MNHLSATLSAKQGKSVCLVTRDGTLKYHTRVPCWIEDHVLVHAHPTDPKRPAVEAPADGRYAPAEEIVDPSAVD